MKQYLLSAFAIVALLFAACGGGDDAPTTIPVSGIKLDKSSLSLEIGEKATLTATIAPSDATNKSITWSSANSSIATVNNGVVEGVATGETTITAKTNDGGFTASATVKVTPEAVKVTQIKLVGVPTTEFKEGRSVTISAVITPNDATDKSVTFTSSNPEVATVEYTKTEDNYSLALLKAVSPGKAKITATANDGSGVKAEAEVNVIPTVKVSEIKIGPENATIAVGETTQFAVAISPADAENREVEWSSSDPSVATIKVTNTNYIAEVTGVGNGTATITATAKDGSGVKASTTVTVLGPMPTSLTINGKKNLDRIYAWHGKVVELDLAYTPANADLTRIFWDISTDSDVVGDDAINFVKNGKLGRVSFKHSYSTSKVEHVYISAYDSEDKNTFFAGININFQTLGWLFDSRYGFNSYSDVATFIGIGDNMNKFNWNKKDYTSGVDFVAYYHTNGLSSVTSPYNEGTYHYYEYYIPNTEYTLTSSDPSKIKVTKNNDGKSWHLERLNTTDLVAVTLTYKCGEHTQTYTINLIP